MKKEARCEAGPIGPSVCLSVRAKAYSAFRAREKSADYCVSFGCSAMEHFIVRRRETGSPPSPSTRLTDL